MSLFKSWRVDYRNATTLTLYDTETSDVLIWLSYYLEKPSQKPDFADFFMTITEQLLFRFS